MSYIPTPEQALELTKRYNKEAFHIQHAETVGKVMRYLAGKYDPGMEDYWQAVGILHDIDFEQWPEEHCKRADVLLRELDIDEGVVHAVVTAGGYAATPSRSAIWRRYSLLRTSSRASSGPLPSCAPLVLKAWTRSPL